MSDTILQVKNLRTSFYTEEGIVRAVDDLSFSLSKGETLAIVGESGCGKSVTSLSILRLIQGSGKIEEGEILYNNKDLLKLTEKEMRSIRGKETSMIFQEPMTSLNPVFTVGKQIGESLKYHQGLNKQEAREKSIEMLKLVRIPDPERSIYRYPHELSGGMRQRVMIAMALACEPKILIADEPTTALDVTIQAQIMDLLSEIKEKTDLAIILITHDLGLVAEIAQNVMIMYGGKAVEYSDIQSIYRDPKHPYTKGLLRSIPRLDVPMETLYSIKGSIPNLVDLPKGCHFAPRCDECMDICKEKMPKVTTLADGRKVRCWKYEDGGIDE